MDEDAARFLMSAEGGTLLDAARACRDQPPHRRVEGLRRAASMEKVRVVLAQDDLRRRALARCPCAEDLLFTEEALQQATAWAVATERATRWPGPADAPLVDLGAGIGLDALAAARAGRPVAAIEQDPVRARLLRHNARALGVADRVEVVEADLLAADLAGPLAYLDPGRRPGGRRTREPEAFEPPRRSWDGLLARFGAAMVKLPPAIREFEDAPFEVVSLDGRARERRLFRGAFGPLPPRRALCLPAGRSIEGPGETWPEARSPREGDWLLDPDAAVTLAGLVGDLAQQTGMAPLHPRIAYLVGSEPAAAAPGHRVRVDALLRPRAREVNAWLKAHGVGRVTIRTRGVADDAAAWRRRLRLRGDAAATLVFTRTGDDRWIALGGLMTDE